jgi:hypothetical protein
MDFNGLELKPGDLVSRRDLHAHVGGQTQSGISPSSTTPLVLLFSNPVAGEQHGYFDGWKTDGYFHYSGEGQRGDQEMRRGNKRIRDHHVDGRELHLFIGEGKSRPVRYEGEFEYVDHYDDEAPETGGGPRRRVFMFRLRPLDSRIAPPTVVGSSLNLSDETVVDDVPTEQHLTEDYYVDPSHEPTYAERREAALVKDYESFAAREGQRLVRKRINVAGELKPLFCDLYDAAANTLIEAKGSVTRESIRMGLGQLYDYRRFIDPEPRLALLLPELPRADLVDFATSCGVQIIYRHEDAFEVSPCVKPQDGKNGGR